LQHNFSFLFYLPDIFDAGELLAELGLEGGAEDGAPGDDDLQVVQRVVLH
jgi:hypothetical protein